MSSGTGRAGAGSPLRIHLALEGGGAGGIAHVGALHAIDEAGMDIRGIAGTSAGALVAGLVAAGYTGKDLFDPGPAPFVREQMASIVYRRKFSDASGLLGPKWPWAVWLIRRIAAADRVPLLLAGLGGLFSLGLLVALVLGPIEVVSLALALTAAAVLVVLAAFWGVRRMHRGLADLEFFIGEYDGTLRDALVTRLKAQPGADPDLVSRLARTDRPVTFDDIHRVTARTLHVVSANLATRDMQVFGTFVTPDAPVARAVAASAGIPGIFAPVVVGHGAVPDAPHHDGGLVSNLPAWAFDDDLAADPDCRVIAVRIADAQRRTPTPPVRTVDWLVALGRTAVFGGSALNMRAMDGRLHVMAIRTDVGLLDFDLDRLEVARRVDDYRLFARTFLDVELLNGPSLLNAACSAIETDVANAIAEQAPGATPPAVRAILAEPVGTTARFMRLVHGPSIRGRSEDGLLLPVDGSLVGAAWWGHARDGLFDAFPFAPAFNLAGPQNERRRAIVKPGVTWRAAMPIYGSGAKSGDRATLVLAVDGEGDARVAHDALAKDDLMKTFAGKIGGILDKLTAERKAAERRARGERP